MIPVLMRLLASLIKLIREYGHLRVPVSAGSQGLEPQYRPPEGRVLPLDELPSFSIIQPNGKLDLPLDEFPS